MYYGTVLPGRAPVNCLMPEAHLSLLFDVYALGQQVRTLVGAAMAGCGLRPEEYAAYSAVLESGPVTLTALARELGLPVTTAADVVRAMRQRGHARRDPHPQDSRAYLLSLTPAGRRVHRRASLAFESAHQALLAQLEPGTEPVVRAVLQGLTESARRAVAGEPAPASTPAAVSSQGWRR